MGRPVGRRVGGPLGVPLRYKAEMSWGTPVALLVKKSGSFSETQLVLEGKKSTAPKPIGYCAANTTTTPGSPRYIWEFAGFDGFDEPDVLRKLLNLCETLDQDESPGKLLNDLGWEIVPIYGEPQ